MHPATLMSCPRIHRRNRRRQTRTAIRDDQRQVLAFQPAAIQILEQAFPVGLTLSLTAQKRQQVTPAIAPHALSHQHLYPLASRWTPHPQAHSIQEQVSIVIAQLGLVKLANRLVQLAGQFRDRLRAHHFAGQGGHYPPHLPRADPAQKCLPDQQRDLLRPPLKWLQTTGQKALLASTRNPQPDGAEAGHKIPLVVAAAAAIPTVYPRARHQRCWVHKMRNILEKVRKSDHAEVKTGAQAIYLAEGRGKAETAFRSFGARWRRQYGAVVRRLEQDLPELLSFFAFPRHLWRKLRTTNVIERCFVEVRRRTRPMVCFVNVESVDRIIYSIFQRFNLEWKTRTLNLFTQAA